MRFFTSGLLAAVAATGFAQAQEWSDADTIVLRDLFGTVTIDFSEGGDVTVAKSGSGADAIDVSGGDTATVDGEKIDRRQFQREYSRLSRRNWGNRKRGEDPAFEEMLGDKPQITISAPVGTSLRIVDSAVKLNASGEAGAVEMEDNIFLLVTMDDIESGSVSVHGSGFVRVGNVEKAFDASVHGSGDIIFKSAGSADLSVHGSGDIEGDDIGSALTASVHGSGDLEVDRVAGRTEARVHGSGDLEIGEAAGGFDGNVHGSGDISVDRVNGALTASVNGSGDLDVARGEVDTLDVSINGSGEFEFGGEARSAVLRSHGSGGIDVARVSGDITASGDDIRVGGRKVGKKD